MCTIWRSKAALGTLCPLARRSEGAVRVRRGPAHDAVTRIECIDDPAIARVNPDVPRPPQDVARANFVDRDFGQRIGDVTRGPWNARADASPSGLREPRTIETRGARAAPAIGFSDLRRRESDDFQRS